MTIFNAQIDFIIADPDPLVLSMAKLADLEVSQVSPDADAPRGGTILDNGASGELSFLINSAYKR